MAESHLIVLETTRLILRRPLLADLPDYWALYQQPEVTRFIPDAPRSLEETREEVEWFLHGHPRRPELGLWATIHKPSGRFAGRCGLLPWTIEGREEVEVAYTLAPEFWGQGLASEAAQAILEHGFGRLGLEKLICLIDPDNAASRRVAEKIGMTLEKRVEGIDGDGIPTLIYARAAKGGL